MLPEVAEKNYFRADSGFISDETQSMRRSVCRYVFDGSGRTHMAVVGELKFQACSRKSPAFHDEVNLWEGCSALFKQVDERDVKFRRELQPVSGLVNLPCDEGTQRVTRSCH